MAVGIPVMLSTMRPSEAEAVANAIASPTYEAVSVVAIPVVGVAVRATLGEVKLEAISRLSLLTTDVEMWQAVPGALLAGRYRGASSVVWNDGSH